MTLYKKLALLIERYRIFPSGNGEVESLLGELEYLLDEEDAGSVPSGAEIAKGEVKVTLSDKALLVLASKNANQLLKSL